MLNRYLDASSKTEELVRWRRLVADREGRNCPGDPDPVVVPWCERINSIPGVCTLQSCAGHECGEDGGRSAGHFWLWLSSDKAASFKQRAFELARNATIEKVSTIYQPWGQEVALIEFRGTPDGKLDESCAAIVGFLTSSTDNPCAASSDCE